MTNFWNKVLIEHAIVPSHIFGCASIFSTYLLSSLGHSFKLAYLRLEVCELKFFHSFLKTNPPKNIIPPFSYLIGLQSSKNMFILRSGWLWGSTSGINKMLPQIWCETQSMWMLYLLYNTMEYVCMIHICSSRNISKPSWEYL